MYRGGGGSGGRFQRMPPSRWPGGGGGGGGGRHHPYRGPADHRTGGGTGFDRGFRGHGRGGTCKLSGSCCQ